MTLPRAVALSLTLVGGTGVARGQGYLANLANSIGSTIYPLFSGDLTLKGPSYLVEVFLYDASKPYGFGLQLGSMTVIRDNGRFNAGSSIMVPGGHPGETADLIIRTWDATKPGGNAYDTAPTRWVTSPFETGVLGGGPAGPGGLPPPVPGKMLTGLPGGFTGNLTQVAPPPIGILSSLENSLGPTIFPIFNPDGVTPLAGPNFKVEVFKFDAAKPGGIGLQLGSTVSPALDGRFNAGDSIEVLNTLPGGVASLIVRAWDVSTGISYDSAKIKGVSPSFQTGALGGDPDGPGPLPAIPAPGMVSGAPGGFQSFSLISPPTPASFSSLANTLGGEVVPIFNPDGHSILAGTGYKIEVFRFDSSKPGGFGSQLGSTVSPDATGIFNAGNSIEIPDATIGSTTALVVRAWDVSTGLSYESAKVKGSSGQFSSGVLGGDPDGTGPRPPIASTGLVSGAPDGFRSFSLISPPTPASFSNLANTLGGEAVPIFDVDGRTALVGLQYKIEVFRFDSSRPGGFGTQLGSTVSPDAKGIFNAGNSIEIPDAAIGSTTALVVRAWDVSTGLSYESAKVKGSSGRFNSGVLGGDPDGTGPRPPVASTGLVSGAADGFKSFSLVNPPPRPPGGGTIATLSNNSGSTIFPILNADGTRAFGPEIKVEVFIFDASEPGGFGDQLGVTVSPSANGRFNAGSNLALPYGGTPGTRTQLIVRAWDVKTGDTYASAYAKGDSGAFWTDTLGGDPDGDGPLLPITPKSMTSGSADGFQSFTIGRFIPIPEPTTIALGALGAVALGLGRRRRAPERMPGA